MAEHTLSKLLLALLLTCAVSGVKLQRGQILLEVTTGEQSEEYKVGVGGTLRQTLQLTQSSRIKIRAKVFFSASQFLPEFFSFRLRHPSLQNVSEPVLAEWSDSQSQFTAFIDLGQPRHIKHMSAPNYQLELIISDDRLDSQTRRPIANCNVTFRNSLTQPLPSELHYVQPSLILTDPPAQRVDPPVLFTGFVVLLLVVLFSIFLYGLLHQKVNLSLFPTGGKGFLVNVLFLGCLGGVLFMLVKFWVSWSFLQTIQWVLVTILPVSLAANYAFVHIRS